MKGGPLGDLTTMESNNTSINMALSTTNINTTKDKSNKNKLDSFILHKHTTPSKITKSTNSTTKRPSSQPRKPQHQHQHTSSPSTTSLSPSLLSDPSITKSLHRISSHPALTPYRRLVYRTLLSVPPGRWTTYATLSAHLNSSARAIGNAMRTNPFAPDVPCHRVLATDRTIGGYKGAWGNGGSYAVEKTKLLKGEGVAFDEKGRAKGECFGDFVDLGKVSMKG